MKKLLRWWTKAELQKLAGLWLAWRLGLVLIGLVAPSLLKYQPSFPYAYTLLPNYGVGQWLYSWANFDGVHYLTIAEKGYLGTGLIQAFFPLYPILIVGLKTLLGNALVAGLVISNVASFVLMYVWFGYIKDLTKSSTAWWATLILFLFPTSFFLGALYSESVFMCLVVGCLWLARHQKWWAAGILAGLASATRVVGIGLVPALLVEWYLHKPRRSKNWLPISLGATGLLAYMVYLDKVFYDPLYFFHVQSEFGAGRQETIVLYPQVVWRYIKILWTYRPYDLKYIALIQEAVVGVMGAVGLVLAARKVPWSWSVFASVAFLVPTLTGSFSSLGRYVLVCLPFWLGLALLCQSHRWLGRLYLLGSIGILILNVVLFVQGYWVA